MPAPKPKKRGRKPRQGWIDGMEPESFPDVDDAAEIYFEAMTARCKLSKEEDEAKDNLIDKMTEHKVASYTTPDGLVVAVTDRKNVKVKRKAENGEAE